MFFYENWTRKLCSNCLLEQILKLPIFYTIIDYYKF